MEATVPKISLIMRKAYGGAYIAMNSEERILRALKLLKTKSVEAPKKKHGNIPL